jgi:hypothetical protein
MQTKQLSLSTARWIALVMYFAGLVTYPFVGAFVRTTPSLPADLMRVLPLILLGAGVVDYVFSLIIESMILAQARKAGNPNGAATAAIVSASFGEGLAIFGFILTLGGAANWGVVLYALCLLHGVHLMLRWPNFERVASGETYESEG